MLIYTKQPPREGGFYFRRFLVELLSGVHHYSVDVIEVKDLQEQGFWAFDTALSRPTWVRPEDIMCEWAGPIQHPIEMPRGSAWIRLRDAEAIISSWTRDGYAPTDSVIETLRDLPSLAVFERDGDDPR
jgi:hypothetical protein